MSVAMAKVLEKHSIYLTTPKELAYQLCTVFVSELLGEHFSIYHSYMEMDAEDFKRNNF